jgi:hypothetical protein
VHGGVAAEYVRDLARIIISGPSALASDNYNQGKNMDNFHDPDNSHPTDPSTKNLVTLSSEAESTNKASPLPGAASDPNLKKNPDDKMDDMSAASAKPDNVQTTHSLVGLCPLPLAHTDMKVALEEAKLQYCLIVQVKEWYYEHINSHHTDCSGPTLSGLDGLPKIDFDEWVVMRYEGGPYTPTFNAVLGPFVVHEEETVWINAIEIYCKSLEKQQIAQQRNKYNQAAEALQKQSGKGESTMA